MVASNYRRPLFCLGQTVATPDALEALQQAGHSPAEFLARHVVGDWGEVCEEDKDANDAAVTEDSRILSAYSLSDGVKIWIITEADRSSTCILLPDEY